MHQVEPKVFLIGKTYPQYLESANWLNELGVDGVKYFNDYVYNVEEDNGIDFYENVGAKLVRLCGKQCYMSFVPGMNQNVTKVREDLGEFIENILKVGHGSVLEHAYYSFALENVSRVFTAEMNRHRAGMAISEGSMRYIRLDDIPYWIPNSIQPSLLNNMTYEENKKKSESQDIFMEVFQFCEKKYKELQEIWKEELLPESKFHLKKQITSMMRRIIPIGVATGGVWTGNIRALRHIFTMRCDESAEEEICMVASMMLEKMVEAEPILFKDFERNEKGYYQPKYRKV